MTVSLSLHCAPRQLPTGPPFDPRQAQPIPGMDICPSMPLDGLTTAVPGDSAPFSSLPMMADNGGLADAHNPADDTALRALLGDLLQDEQLFSELPELAPHGVGELERG